MTDHQLAYWTMIGTAVSGVGTLVAALIALVAAMTWRNGLKQQRGDELVAAMNDCAAAIGRTITRTNKNMAAAPGGLGVDEAWASWARLRTAHAVAARYYPRLTDRFLDEAVALLTAMEAFTEQPGSLNNPQGNAINDAFGRLKTSEAAKVR